MSVVINGTSGITTNAGTLISASTIGVGGTAPASSGAGISFPATQSASTDANTLDDYEEGTWTVTDQSGASLTLSNTTGTYIKIGKLVFFSFDITFPVTANTNTPKLSLPFAVVAGGGSVSYSNATAVPYAFLSNGTTYVTLYKQGGTTMTNVENSGKELAISGCYQTTA